MANVPPVASGTYGSRISHAEIFIVDVKEWDGVYLQIGWKESKHTRNRVLDEEFENLAPLPTNEDEWKEFFNRSGWERLSLSVQRDAIKAYMELFIQEITYEALAEMVTDVNMSIPLLASLQMLVDTIEDMQ